MTFRKNNNGITDVMLLESISKFLFDSVGNLPST